MAQEKKNEVGLLLGGIVTPDQTVRTAAGATVPVKIGAGLSFQATYARRLATGSLAALDFEVPFVATPSADVRAGLAQVPRNYASLFLTPGFRLTLAAASPVAPWFAFGGGYARFDESTTTVSGAVNRSQRGTNGDALQFGGGVDLKTPVHILFPIGLRAEVRDFYSAQPNFGAPSTGDRQHNVVFSGGLVLRF